MKNTIFFTLSIVLLFFGCVKSDIIHPNNITYDNSFNNRQLSATFLTGQPSFPLDWENISYMPEPIGVTPVPVPWQSGLGGVKIDQDMLYDYARSDGWELVYNTFNDSIVYDPSYFMLYNKYRGILRTYFYFAPGQNYPSNNIVSELLLNGTSSSSSPVLNFSGSDIVDVGTNHLAVTQLQPYQVSSTGAWYASEFELAYDPNISAVSYPNSTMEWQINPNSIAQISLNGNQTGSIDGTISIPSSKTNFFGSLVNTAVSTAVTAGASYASGGLDFLAKETNGVKDNTIKNAAVSGITNAISGTISGFLNGVFGFTKKSTTNQKVSLTLNTSITVNGTSTVSSQLFDNNFAIPGTANNTQAIPFFPAYNEPLGVFYISDKPTVDVTQTKYNLNSPPNVAGSRVKFTFVLDNSSFSLLFNPSVLSIADIQNIRYDILTPTPFAGYTVDRQNSSLSEEDIMGTTYFGFGSSSYLTFAALTVVNNFFVNKVFVRVSFDVVPKDGAPKQTIVKTFKVNVVSN